MLWCRPLTTKCH